MLRPGGLAGYRLEGLIAAVYSNAVEAEILSLGIPAVNVSSALAHRSIPSVRIDQHQIGVVAAEYFLARGYRHFLFVPDRGDHHAFIAERGQGFITTARAAGGAVSVHADWPESAFPNATRGRGALTSWIAALPKPVAIFASSDFAAAEVHAEVVAAKITVPEQAAILGVGDEHEAHFGDWGISSIATPYESVGYRAAAMLDAMLDGSSPAPAPLQTLPIRVISRVSTDARAVDDVEALQALRYIREHACAGIGVGDVVEQVPLSRRTLERRFRAAFGRTIRQDIQRNRIAQARKLLAATHLGVGEVAAASGFQDRSQFFITFRAETGLSPTAYRTAQQQLTSDGDPSDRV